MFHLNNLWILEYRIRILARFFAMYCSPESYYGDNIALNTQIPLRSAKTSVHAPTRGSDWNAD